ncbi:hypothetical protein STENM223S_08619 [Streptomyces tendae]
MTGTTGHVQLVRDGTLARLGPAGDIDGVGGTTPDGLFAPRRPPPPPLAAPRRRGRARHAPAR